MPSREAVKLRSALTKLRPLVIEQNIETGRKMQDRLGKLAAGAKHGDVRITDVEMPGFSAARIAPVGAPADPRCILYLHGGAYVMGGIEYAKGFGSILARDTSLRVFCAAYRLAPEHPYPAAVEDALCAFDHLIGEGFAPGDIILAGESAGGGLLFCLMHMLNRLGREMPGGAIAISPWTDLTCAGATYRENADTDPTIDRDMLLFHGELYARGAQRDPMVSPLFGELEGFPPCLILAGGGEMLLDDSRMMAARLRDAGCWVELYVEPGMWHVYPLYGTPEAKTALELAKGFLEEIRDE